MTDINTGPLTKAAYELCRMIDALPYASLELTKVISVASDFISVCEAREIGIREALLRFSIEETKAREFKEYVHGRLDAAGVPVDPESPHKAAGCRIGGRLDVLIGERDMLRAAEKHNTAWLIESTFASTRPQWWNGTPEGQFIPFTSDANEAVRFARRIDAERVATFMHMVRVNEHVWLPA